MPAPAESLAALKSKVDKYIGEADAEVLFTELYDEIGSKSSNKSFNITMLMLKILYKRDGASLDDKMASMKQEYIAYYLDDWKHTAWQTALFTVVFLHFVLIFFLLLDLIMLPYLCTVWVAIPLMVFIVNLIATPVVCSCTKLENVIRKKLNKPEIRSFVKHYWCAARDMRKKADSISAR